MDIINLLPYKINIVTPEGELIREFDPSEGTIVVQEFYSALTELDDIPILKQNYGQVLGVPEPKEDTYYIVSKQVQNALPSRTDFLVPDQQVKTLHNEVLGFKGLSKY